MQLTLWETRKHNQSDMSGSKIGVPLWSMMSPQCSNGCCVYSKDEAEPWRKLGTPGNQQEKGE